MLFFEPETVASDSTVAIPGADVYLFGIMQSAAFSAWQETVGGRLESRLRFSVGNVYNTFPWPEPTDAQRLKVSQAAQGVLDARAAHPGVPIGDLYESLGTPLDIIRAHRELDKAVDKAFGRRTTFRTDAERLGMLFERYVSLTQRLVVPSPVTRPKRMARARVR